MNLEKIISYLCNNENKCVTLAYVLSEDWQIPKHMNKKFNTIFPDIELKSKSILNQICEYSLLPAGLVDKKYVKNRNELLKMRADYVRKLRKTPISNEELEKEKKDYIHQIRIYPIHTYKLNKEGKKAIPIAKFILHKSYEFGESVYNFFGSTNSNFKKANQSRSLRKPPYTNLRILEKLFNNKPMRERDFKIGLDYKIVGTKLKKLHKKGFINYSSIKTLKGKPVLNDECKKIFGNYPINPYSNARINEKGLRFYNEIILPIKEYVNGNNSLILDELSKVSESDLLIKAKKGIMKYCKINPHKKKIVK